MQKIIKVGVKFCGNCNPRYDMPGLYKWLLTQASGITFVSWEEPYDVLLVLSSCPVDCASRPAFTSPVINVTNEAVDRGLVGYDDLPHAVLKVLMKYVNGSKFY